MTDVVRVFTPVRRVPTMIAKAPNGRKLPFGPYTLAQIAGGSVVMFGTSVALMTLPWNPATTFVFGLAFAAFCVFGLGLIPLTGVRLSSRALWWSRMLFRTKPLSASSMPIDVAAGREAVFVDMMTVIVLPPDYYPPAEMASSVSTLNPPGE
ncbi:MAG: hypothetical protein HOQ24_03350 [Mycobacteriaceae bacterium]|nr:hypothetical protein [Mycobacteriaceae bacterium]